MATVRDGPEFSGTLPTDESIFSIPHMIVLIDFDRFCYHIDTVSLNISDPSIRVLAP